MTYDLHRFTTKELLNYVLYDSGAAVNVQGYMSGELLNLILNDSTPALNVRFLGGTIESGIYLGEQAAALADITAYGQIWVKNDTPNTLWFTDDTGVDYKLSGSLHMYTGVDATNPASSDATTTAIVDAYSGVIITLTLAGNAQTIGTPTVSDAGKRFTVVNNDTSTNTIEINGIVLEVGHAQSWMWDGSAWTLATSTDADQITYNPAASYLTATDVQGAIDGLVPAVAGTTEDSKALVTDASGDVDLSGGYLSNEQTTTNMMSKGTVYRFDGVDDYITVTDGPNVNFGTGDFSFHIKYTPENVTDAQVYLVSKGAAGVDYGIELRTNDLWIRFDDATADASAVIGTDVFTAGTEYDIVVTFDRSGNATGYVDGVAVGTVDISSVFRTITTGSALKIGARVDNNLLFNGSIGLVEAYNTALSASEVKDLISGNIPFKWQYGSQTPIVTANGDFEDDTNSPPAEWTNVGNHVATAVADGTAPEGNNVVEIVTSGDGGADGTGGRVFNSSTNMVVGKEYRASFSAKSISGNTTLTVVGIEADPVTITTSWAEYSQTFTATQIRNSQIWLRGTATVRIDDISVTQLGAVALYTQDSISETAWYDKANGNDGAVTGAEVLNAPSVTPLLAMHSNAFRIQPGATPGTNINIDDLDVGAWNQSAITDTTNLAKSGSGGSFALDADGKLITVDITKEVVGIIGYGIKKHDLNSSSTTEMYFINADVVAGNIRLQITKRGSTSNVDFTTILDAGDNLQVWVSYVTAT
jgi:hypothetical protein